MTPVRRITAFLRERWVPLLVAGILLFLVFGNSGFDNLLRNYKELRHLRAELSALGVEEKSLQKKLHLIEHEDSYLERMARKELGYMKPGEMEYRFPPPQK